MFKRVLISNRGLIQANCVRAVKELGATAITVFDDEDRDSAGVRNADEAHRLEVRDPRTRPYLDIEQIVDLAKQQEVDAVHPGYGFLAQNAKFARALEKHGIEIIAPSARGMLNLSNKWHVKEAARSAGLPVLKGTGAFSDSASLMEQAKRLTFPIIMKPVHGFGGIGVRVVSDPAQLESAFDGLQAICGKFLMNSPEVFLEEYLPHARHIEFPVLRDKSGRTTVFPEMECSLQRRFQKLLAESPAPDFDPDLPIDNYIADGFIQVIEDSLVFMNGPGDGPLKINIITKYFLLSIKKLVLYMD